jgi:hypothetical protein
MIASSHHVFSAEIFDTSGDTRIIRCDNDAGEHCYSESSFDNVLDHRFSANHGERLTSKSI